ncbi:hypothetical protein Tsubulata_050507 [Turnera subulata]|uniref:DC1 domain-containing protein n=1 Tax=Turnera subulata TaxID=218843 RepID=A0A9Q0J789_9ROSI|nr:hypothetical protein Tsubulata_050507 [Turnera subulata]
MDDLNSSSLWHPPTATCQDCSKLLAGPAGACCGCSAAHDFRIQQHHRGKLPKKVYTILHPDHLLAYTPSSDIDHRCNLCYQSFGSYYYACPSCPFVIHLTCAFPPCIYNGQRHEVLNLRTLSSVRLYDFICNACGVVQREDRVVVGDEEEEANPP